jgi:hypothetical protein
MIVHKVDECFDETSFSLSEPHRNSGIITGSGKVNLSTVTSVNLRILEMSSIPPSLNVAVMLLFSMMTSVIWTKAAFEAAEMKVGRGVGMVGPDGTGWTGWSG